jgi:hypothetical protein
MPAIFPIPNPPARITVYCPELNPFLDCIALVLLGPPPAPWFDPGGGLIPANGSSKSKADVLKLFFSADESVDLIRP